MHGIRCPEDLTSLYKGAARACPTSLWSLLCTSMYLSTVSEQQHDTQSQLPRLLKRKWSNA